MITAWKVVGSVVFYLFEIVCIVVCGLGQADPPRSPAWACVFCLFGGLGLTLTVSAIPRIHWVINPLAEICED